MKVWSWIILVVLAQLGGMNDKARATTFDVPLNGEIEITGDITTPTWVTFFVVANSNPSNPLPAGSPTSSEASWLFNIALTQSNGSGGFSTPQVCELKRQLLSFIQLSWLRWLFGLQRNNS